MNITQYFPPKTETSRLLPVRSLLMVVLFVSGIGSSMTMANETRSESSLFAQPWISGLNEADPLLQAQHYDADTVVIRQSLKSSFEAPFMYLIFGQEKVLLIDTGAGGVPLRGLVDEQIKTWLESTGGETISLVVMHSHAHGDHVGGDEQFTDRANTVVVGHGAKEVADFFQLDDWPGTSRPFDLGGRVVELIPTPGHHDSHVMVYDHATGLLFSGDMLYPGRLYFQCGKAQEYKSSINRVIEFSKTHAISQVLGAHIELAQRPGKSYSSQDLSRKNERLLELKPAAITAVAAAFEQMGKLPRVKSYDDFILFPHPVDPRGKQPPDWCQGNDKQ